MNLYSLVLIVLVVVALLLFERPRKAVYSGIEKLFEILVSKRFITLMIATWFVYRDIDIDPNWLYLAGFYIGIDTMQNNGVFTGVAKFLENRKAPAKE